MKKNSHQVFLVCPVATASARKKERKWRKGVWRPPPRVARPSQVSDTGPPLGVHAQKQLRSRTSAASTKFLGIRSWATSFAHLHGWRTPLWPPTPPHPSPCRNCLHRPRSRLWLVVLGPVQVVWVAFSSDIVVGQCVTFLLLFHSLGSNKLSQNFYLIILSSIFYNHAKVLKIYKSLDKSSCKITIYYCNVL